MNRFHDAFGSLIVLKKVYSPGADFFEQLTCCIDSLEERFPFTFNDVVKNKILNPEIKDPATTIARYTLMMLYGQVIHRASLNKDHLGGIIGLESGDTLTAVKHKMALFEQNLDRWFSYADAQRAFIEDIQRPFRDREDPKAYQEKAMTQDGLFDLATAGAGVSPDAFERAILTFNQGVFFPESGQPDAVNLKNAEGLTLALSTTKCNTLRIRTCFRIDLLWCPEM